MGLLLVAVLPAVCEELVFRATYTKKLIRFGEGPYILLSGFLFGTYHGNLEQFFYAFVMGCCLAFWCAARAACCTACCCTFLMNFLSVCVLLPLENSLAFAAFLGWAMLAVIGMGIGFFVQLRRGLRLPAPRAARPPGGGRAFEPGHADLDHLLCAAGGAEFNLVKAKSAPSLEGALRCVIRK